jgi:hypothetical protein
MIVKLRRRNAQYRDLTFEDFFDDKPKAVSVLAYREPASGNRRIRSARAGLAILSGKTPGETACPT